MSKTGTWLKRLAVLPPIAVGVVVLVLQVTVRDTPEQAQPEQAQA